MEEDRVVDRLPPSSVSLPPACVGCAAGHAHVILLGCEFCWYSHTYHMKPAVTAVTLNPVHLKQRETGQNTSKHTNTVTTFTCSPLPPPAGDSSLLDTGSYPLQSLLTETHLTQRQMPLSSLAASPNPSAASCFSALSLYPWSRPPLCSFAAWLSFLLKWLHLPTEK